ncbi:MAG: chloride channel protein [Nitriliruptorales bacterium]
MNTTTLQRVEAAFRRVRSELLIGRASSSVILGLGAGVGFVTGLAAAALIAVIRIGQRVAWPNDPGWLAVILVPTVGALLVGVLLTYAFPESSGSGVIQTMRTVALRGGRFRVRVPFGGVLSSGLALGTGASGGREGPIVLIGGSIGSIAGRLFALTDEGIRTLVAAGAAAGIGASFNAPIGGMLFAIELIIGEFRAQAMQVIVVASVVGSVTARQIVGPELVFRPQEAYGLNDPRELLLYALLGLAAVGVGLAFIHAEDLAKRFFARLRVWRPAKLALGGLGVGLVALAIPEVLGTGSRLPPVPGAVLNPIQHMLDGGFGVGWAAVGLLLLLAAAKLTATALSIGSGNAIGTFAPALFVGAAVGGAVGHMAETLLPGAGVQPGAFAVVGMAAAFSAVAHAPLTSILIAFELTGDYGLVLPLMLAAGLSVFVIQRIQPLSVYSFPLKKEGIVYAEPSDVDIMQTVTVGEIMTRDPDLVPPYLSLPQLREEFERTRHHGFPVVEDGDRLVGVVTLTDLAEGQRRVASGVEPLPRFVADICTRRPITVTPDDPVFRALRRMAALDVGRLPVVAADDHGRFVGLLRRSDVVAAYQRAVTRSLGVQQRREASRLRDLLDAQFVELVVSADAPAADREVREIRWPRRTILTSIRRRGELILPHGDTVLEAGDEIVLLTDRDSAPEVQRLLAGDVSGGD